MEVNRSNGSVRMGIPLRWKTSYSVHAFVEQINISWNPVCLIATTVVIYDVPTPLIALMLHTIHELYSTYMFHIYIPAELLLRGL